jgi:predicted transcriptional regulator
MITEPVAHEFYIIQSDYAAMKYRSRTDIASQILEAANRHTTKTRLMYKSFLSYAQLKEYLSVLIKNGLLEYDKATDTFKTTEKGVWFLSIYNKMDEFMAEPTSASNEIKGRQ